MESYIEIPFWKKNQACKILWRTCEEPLEFVSNRMYILKDKRAFFKLLKSGVTVDRIQIYSNKAASFDINNV